MGMRFARMDVNKDGYVDVDDLQCLVNSITQDFSESTAHQLREVFEEGWRRIWSYGMYVKHMRVSRTEFLRGYTHTIKSTARRESLRHTLSSVLGEFFDAFDEARHGQLLGHLTKQEFIAFHMRWNVSAAEAEQLFLDITGSPRPGPQLDGEVIDDDPTITISKQDYMNAAWDFYFSMPDKKPYRPGTNFYGILRSADRKHLTF